VGSSAQALDSPCRPVPIGGVERFRCWRWLSAVLACVTLLIVGGCTEHREELGGASMRGLSQAVSATALPGITLAELDEIPALDFTVDRHGTVHVIWRALIKDAEAPHRVNQLWYMRGPDAGTRWDAPRRIDAPGYSNPCIAVVGEMIHVVLGGKLRHLVSGDAGLSWSEQPQLVPDDRHYAVSYEFVEHAGAMIGVYAVRDGGAQEPPAGEQSDDTCVDIYFTEITDGEPIATRVARTCAPGPSRTVPLAMVVDDDITRVTWAMNHTDSKPTTVGGRTLESFSVHGRLFHASSRDLGSSWSEPVEIPLVDDGESLPSIVSLDLVSFLDRTLIVLGTSGGLYGVHVEREGAWSEPVIIARGKHRSSSSWRSESVDVDAIGDIGAMVWIDGRYQKSDRSLLNPLGGIPWNDDPNWGNNDVFLLSWSGAGGIDLHDRTPKARRLSPALSRARMVKLHCARDRTYVLWAGRERIGRGTRSRATPPQVFMTRW
jgi:hypothetical protein